VVILGELMKTGLIILAALSAFSASQAHAGCLVTQHRFTVETRCNLGDLDEADQRKLMFEFIDRVRDQIAAMNIPKKMDATTDKLFDQAQSNLAPLIEATNRYSKDYRESRGGTLRDLIPSGFFFELGLNGSVNVGPGFGTSLLLTFAAVPTRVKIIDKQSGTETDRTDWQQDSGGLIQLGGGLGGGGGFGMRGGAGIIWGDLPHPSDVIGSGLAEGASVDAQFFGGAGLTAIDTKNTETGLNNITVFAHFDGGPGAKVEFHGCAFYLMNRQELGKVLHVDELQVPAKPGTPPPAPPGNTSFTVNINN
jgi:hypothetical protein